MNRENNPVPAIINKVSLLERKTYIIKVKTQDLHYYAYFYMTYEACTIKYVISVHVFLRIRMSHSIYMLNIQIDVKSLEIGSTTSNCPSLQAL